VAGLLTWSFGSMTGAGATNANGGVNIISSPSCCMGLFGGRVFNNAATATITNNGVFFISTGAGFNNLAGATFDAQADATIASAGGKATFNNTGGLKKSAGTGTTTFSSVPFNNTGTVEVTSGALSVGGGTSSGPFNASGNGLVFNGSSGTHDLSLTANISAATVNFAGNVNIASPYNVTNTT